MARIVRRTTPALDAVRQAAANAGTRVKVKKGTRDTGEIVFRPGIRRDKR